MVCRAICHCQEQRDEAIHAIFSGKVRTLTFVYTRTSDGKIFCHVNIVVEETDDDRAG